MYLTLPKTSLNNTYSAFLRQAGYAYIEDRRTGHSSFVRAFGRNNYPRFHVYVLEDNNKIVFNAHLDQKQAIYEGVSAHSGEYDSPLVKEELERLQALLGTGTINSGRPTSFHAPERDNSPEGKSKRWDDLIKGN